MSRSLAIVPGLPGGSSLPQTSGRAALHPIVISQVEMRLAELHEGMAATDHGTPEERQRTIWLASLAVIVKAFDALGVSPFHYDALISLQSKLADIEKGIVSPCFQTNKPNGKTSSTMLEAKGYVAVALWCLKKAGYPSIEKAADLVARHYPTVGHLGKVKDAGQASNADRAIDAYEQTRTRHKKLQASGRDPKEAEDRAVMIYATALAEIDEAMSSIADEKEKVEQLMLRAETHVFLAERILCGEFGLKAKGSLGSTHFPKTPH